MTRAMPPRQGTPEWRDELEKADLEGVIADALVRRGGLQIGVELQVDIHGRSRGGAITTLLQHPKAGRLGGPEHLRLIKTLGLEQLAFYRRISKVFALQRRLTLLGLHLPCTIAAPASLLVDVGIIRRVESWLTIQELPAERVRFHIGDCSPLVGEEALARGLQTLRSIGFGLAMDLQDLDRVACRAAMDLFQVDILFRRDLVAEATAVEAWAERLRQRMAFIAGAGSEAVACEIASKQCALEASAFGFTVLQGDHFTLPNDVGGCLRAVNSRG